MESAPEANSREIEKALDRLVEDQPALTTLVAAFRDLMIEQARFRESSAESGSRPNIEIDPERFRQGVPVLGPEKLVPDNADLKGVIRTIAPALAKGFPTIASDVAVLTDSESEGRIDLEAAALAFLKQDTAGIDNIAATQGINRDTLVFIMAQTVRPLLEKLARSLTPLPEGLDWLKGYCPICGSWPSISFLVGKEGQRRLKCSLCSHEWRFIRTECPFCDNNDFQTMEYFFSEQRPYERAEVCHKCKKYLLSLDIREMTVAPPLEVAGLSMVYLDIWAQQQGYEPGAISQWNAFVSGVASDTGEA